MGKFITESIRSWNSLRVPLGSENAGSSPLSTHPRSINSFLFEGELNIPDNFGPDDKRKTVICPEAKADANREDVKRFLCID